jgi:hypothetical protein
LFEERDAMKAVLLTAWICLGAFPAFAQLVDAAHRHHGAPAPLIGAGIPALVVVGGVLLGRKLLRRRKRQQD